MYINGLQKGEIVVIVDDIISTGGTLKAVLSVLKDIGVNVKGVIVAVDKGDCAEEVDKEFDVKIMALIKMDINDDEIRIT